MISSKTLISIAATAALVGTIGFTNAQSTPSADTSRSGDKSLPQNQPATSGTMTPRTTTTPDTAVTGTTKDTTRTDNKSLPANQGTTSSGQAMPMGSTMANQPSTGTMGSTTTTPTPMPMATDSSTRAVPSDNMNNSSSGTTGTSGMSGTTGMNNDGRTITGERPARADRN